MLELILWHQLIDHIIKIETLTLKGKTIISNNNFKIYDSIISNINNGNNDSSNKNNNITICVKEEEEEEEEENPCQWREVLERH